MGIWMHVELAEGITTRGVGYALNSSQTTVNGTATSKGRGVDRCIICGMANEKYCVQAMHIHHSIIPHPTNRPIIQPATHPSFILYISFYASFPLHLPTPVPAT
ncbi:hypothetical protein EYC84_002031 [Monilinia fructicola]|uniref:Uncharacterized protein n=1 Tax=Monilinia fructicola TaxID=38448 RepID=A0A5M9JVG4_MONFR|nr:hypothetical protein EYC84_002031 [Monilinia fructicola]